MWVFALAALGAAGIIGLDLLAELASRKIEKWSEDMHHGD